MDADACARLPDSTAMVLIVHYPQHTKRSSSLRFQVAD